MKKLIFLALMGLSCLLLTSIPLNAQVSRKGEKGKTEVQKETTSHKTSTTTSRKRVPGKSTSTKRDTPRRENSGVARQGARQNSGGQHGRYRGHNKGAKTKAKAFKYKSKNSKAKCGVKGCEHPGKHKGLHKKQQVVRPIYFGKQRH